MSVNYVALGKRIGYFRMQCGNITQEALASKINRSREFLAKIEKGTEHPSVATLVDIADALCISIDDLLIDSLHYSVSTSNTELHRLLLDCKHRCTLAVFCILDCCLQALLQTMTRKNVVAQHHSHRIVTDKVGTNNKGLCQSIRRRLNSIGQIHTKLVSITQQVLETRCILRCGNNQNITDAGVHQNGHRIINHRFIVDWQKIFTCYLC